MRIGIITLPLRTNYGGILQNWALQHVLLSLGHDPITIDAYERLSFKGYIKDICRYFYYHVLLHTKYMRSHWYKGRNTNKRIGVFVEKNIIKTMPICDYDESIIDKYGIECVIVGSDQVWRPKYNHRTEDLYLDFLRNRKIKKFVYCASFGSNEWEYSPELTQKCASLASSFNAVSVRETSAVALCQEHLGVKAELVLDPTLLVDGKVYESMCKSIRTKTKPFLAVYCLDTTDAKMRLFKRMAKEFNLNLRIFRAENNAKLSIPKWISMFRDASMIVTDSYHGTIFSIIFRKRFYSMLNVDRGNARVQSLLDQLNLTNQIIDEDTTLFPDVDYSNVTEKLSLLKRTSLQFLNENLQE